ncbi:17245_t:CDS:2, partial [Funneliformis caledonium]
DKDIYQMITEYLQNISCDVTVDKFKTYVKQEVFSRSKDIYYNGYERSDVFEY